MWNRRSCTTVAICALTSWKLTNFQISLCDRGSCWNWNESRHRQHWRHLRNQHGIAPFPLHLVNMIVSVIKEMNELQHHLFRTTPQLSSSVSGGVIQGWCSREMRVWAWTGAWCRCSGSLTPSSRTPSALSCMTSRWKTASYASSVMERFSTPCGTCPF